MAWFGRCMHAYNLEETKTTTTTAVAPMRGSWLFPTVSWYSLSVFISVNKRRNIYGKQAKVSHFVEQPHDKMVHACSVIISVVVCDDAMPKASLPCSFFSVWTWTEMKLRMCTYVRSTVWTYENTLQRQYPLFQSYKNNNNFFIMIGRRAKRHLFLFVSTFYHHLTHQPSTHPSRFKYPNKVRTAYIADETMFV